MGGHHPPPSYSKSDTIIRIPQFDGNISLGSLDCSEITTEEVQKIPDAKVSGKLVVVDSMLDDNLPYELHDVGKS